MENVRRVQIKINNEWKDIKFADLKKGDVFRLFEPDEKEVIDDYGHTEFLATSNIHIKENKTPSISIESQKDCGNCRFYDGDNGCCMYNCRVVAIFDCEESAKECNWFELGFYNQDELEKTNYK